MRLIFICLFVVNFCAVFGQVLCDSISNNDKYGDYPPGCTLCSDFLNGNNIGYSPDDTISYDFSCGEVENSIWYSFYNVGQTLGFVEIEVSDCNLNKGLEVAVFDENFNRISSCFSIQNFNRRRISIPSIAPKLLYIMIDGIDGDECNFNLSNNLQQGILLRKIVRTPAQDSYCLGAVICYSSDRNFVSESHEWQIPISDSIVSGGVNEDEICLYFKTPGTKNISLNVTHPCFTENYSDSIFIKDRPTFVVDSFVAVYDQLCLEKVVRFEAGWDNDSILLDWKVPTSHFQRLNGGFLSSNFYEGKVLNTGDVTVSVAPLDQCGLQTELNLTTGSSLSQFISADICSENCYTVGDSCYYGNQTIRTIQVEPTVLGCDSFVRLRLRPLEVFPSPLTFCNQVDDGVLVVWEKFSGVDSTIIFVNRDSVASTTANAYLIEEVPADLLFDVKIQPIGNCTYLPAEIKCQGISNINSTFINSEITVYPNPTTGKITIETDLQIEEIKIYNAAGQFLQKEKTTSFDLKNLESGIYFLKIKTNEGVGVKRILVSSQ